MEWKTETKHCVPPNYIVGNPIRTIRRNTIAGVVAANLCNSIVSGVTIPLLREKHSHGVAIEGVEQEIQYPTGRLSATRQDKTSRPACIYSSTRVGK